MITRDKVNAAFERQAVKNGIPRDKVWNLYADARNDLPNDTTMWDVLMHIRDIWCNREMTIDEGVGWS